MGADEAELSQAVERSRSEALDVGGDEGEFGLKLKPKSTHFGLISGN